MIPKPAKKDRAIMGLGDHLEELRLRVIWGVLGLIPLLIFAMMVADPALKLVTIPVQHALLAAGEPSGLIATSPIETFIAWLKIGLIITIAVGFPWILLQLWLFIAPGLYQAERRFAYILIPGSAVLSSLALVFLYKAMLPLSLYFLISFGSHLATSPPPTAPLPEGITAQQLQSDLVVLAADPPESVRTPGMMWFNESRRQLRYTVSDGTIMNLPFQSDALVSQQYRIESYVDLVFWLGLAFIIAFQLPLVMLLGAWTGIVRPEDLAKRRRIIYFALMLAGAVFTPQDPWSMLMLGGAMVILFEFGLFLMRIPPSVIAGNGMTTDADEEA